MGEPLLAAHAINSLPASTEWTLRARRASRRANPLLLITTLRMGRREGMRGAALSTGPAVLLFIHKFSVFTHDVVASRFHVTKEAHVSANNTSNYSHKHLLIKI